MSKKDINKIVLAYSGGLDTSVAIKWIKDEYDAEVIAFAADVGQNEDLEPLEEKALATGASKIYIEDLKEEFLKDYAFKGLKAGAKYEGKYPLATAYSRPLIAKKMIEIAKKEGADAVAHGCTGKGNDQVRFDVSYHALDPDIKIVAPLREWEFGSREEEIDYANENDIPVGATKENPYSIDRNLWGISIECGILEDPWAEPPAEVYQITAAPEDAPDEAEYIEVTFANGEPIALNGEELGPVELVNELNEIAAKHGVGRVDMVENRLVGIKSREIYEAPAAEVLLDAHRHLEDLVLDRETYHYKELISEKYAELTYYGQWFSPLREALDAFIDSTQQYVNGTIRVKLYKGNATVVGRKSDNSLYQENLATYEKSDTFNHDAAIGFIELFGLPLKVHGKVNNE
ncbi:MULTISPECIES: argininosuccinate synthase [unclassified Candidatus Frackibacter]|uniref:argininosuccinate synthase n=1 Tax=unclassified Candidatus Frackibacter TaxID=2648818 RepID=UPI000888EF4B|nr:MULTISPECIES: argininosuccinate synthase [unclassified Candidatus Frackibacter]SDB97269.1 argininosuccinate synthase [Candidatus Frackibacter sp. WG11]SEM28951.1 argininosuccinate synthase [Candidatus Frackibacter sp. WG12]SFL33786.1 argininosuccinate synthase [Candidatus Frackibacter sp. WG13]